MDKFLEGLESTFGSLSDFSRWENTIEIAKSLQAPRNDGIPVRVIESETKESGH